VKVGCELPILVVATNQNDILHRCLTRADTHKERVHASISRSMDIQVSPKTF